MMKYKTGQAIILNDGYRLEVNYVDEDENIVDYTLWTPPQGMGSYIECEDYEIPESTVDAIIAHHNRR